MVHIFEKGKFSFHSAYLRHVFIFFAILLINNINNDDFSCPIGLKCSDVTMFPDHSNYFGE